MDMSEITEGDVCDGLGLCPVCRCEACECWRFTCEEHGVFAPCSMCDAVS